MVSPDPVVSAEVPGSGGAEAEQMGWVKSLDSEVTKLWVQVPVPSLTQFSEPPPVTGVIRLLPGLSRGDEDGR